MIFGNSICTEKDIEIRKAEMSKSQIKMFGKVRFLFVDNSRKEYINRVFLLETYFQCIICFTSPDEISLLDKNLNHSNLIQVNPR